VSEAWARLPARTLKALLRDLSDASQTRDVHCTLMELANDDLGRDALRTARRWR
jgi:hypothetical protein